MLSFEAYLCKLALILSLPPTAICHSQKCEQLYLLATSRKIAKDATAAYLLAECDSFWGMIYTPVSLSLLWLESHRVARTLRWSRTDVVRKQILSWALCTKGAPCIPALIISLTLLDLK